MAKINGSLFSMEGSGKIAKSKVYSKWKGIKTARQYKVPRNPQTEEQQEGRNYMKNAVVAWKTRGYTKLDINAWNILASMKKKAKSGYNQYLTEYMNCMHSDKRWNSCFNPCFNGCYSSTLIRLDHLRRLIKFQSLF